MSFPSVTSTESTPSVSSTATSSTVSSTSGTPGFGFSFSSVDDFKDKLDALGGGEITTMQQFWRYSMEVFVSTIDTVMKELVTLVTTEEERKTIDPSEYMEKRNRFASMVSKISWTDADMTLDPTAFYNKFFVNMLNVRTLTGSPKLGWRKLFEHKGASDQCAIAEKNIRYEFMDWDTCYICGNPIYDSYNPLNPYPEPIHDSRECEHILPAFSSLGYKGLIQSQKSVTDVSPDVIKFYSYEYANAHRCCNQIKTDDKWILYNTETSKYDVDIKTLTDTLTNIHKGGAYDCDAVKQNMGNSSAKFVNSRREEIIQKYLNPLVTIINRDKHNFGDLYQLSVRIRQIYAIRKNLRELAHAFLTGEILEEVKVEMVVLDKSLRKCKKILTSNDHEVLNEIFCDIFSANTLSFEETLSIFINYYQDSSMTRNRTTQALLMRVLNNGLKENRKIFAQILNKNTKAAQAEINSLFADNQPKPEPVVTDIINKYSVLRTRDYYDVFNRILMEVYNTNTMTPSMIEKLAVVMQQLKTTLESKLQDIQTTTKEDLDDQQRREDQVRKEANTMIGTETGPLVQGGEIARSTTLSKVPVFRSSMNVPGKPRSTPSSMMTLSPSPSPSPPTMSEDTTTTTELKQDILQDMVDLFEELREDGVLLKDPNQFIPNYSSYITRSGRTRIQPSMLTEGVVNGKRVQGINLNGEFFMYTPHGLYNPRNNQVMLYTWKPRYGRVIIMPDGSFINSGLDSSLRGGKKRLVKTAHKKRTNRRRTLRRHSRKSRHGTTITTTTTHP